jgi:prepilin-type N-terminal cleavage/methylation domain-containing protein
MNLKQRDKGFTLVEAVTTVAIVGTLSSIALPNYISSKERAHCSDAKATMMSIPPIIGAYIDATGETPTTWDDLSSIAVVMTSNGPATGALNTPIKLPRTNYELSIEGPSESTYLLTANCYVKTPESDPANSEEELAKDAEKYKIRSCFSVSNGASDLTKGSGTDPANTPNCG